MFSFAPVPFYLGERAHWIESWAGWYERCGKEKILVHTRIEPRLLRRPAFGIFSTPTLTLSFI